METIIVVGYPKSGNTWMARLVGELLQCPVRGFWGQPENPDVAIEGLDRESDYQVFKGHHLFDQIRNEIDLKHIIYVVRDVRDIVISASYYFELQPYDNWRRRLYQLPEIGKILDKYFIHIQRRKIQRMVEVVDAGNKDVPWCYWPWDVHINPYLNNPDVLMVRFEDLLSQPRIELIRVLNHLSIEPTPEDQINEAIIRQSFDNVKARFLEKGDKRRLNFLRSGKSGNWKRDLSKRQKKFLLSRFGKELRELRYINYP